MTSEPAPYSSTISLPDAHQRPGEPIYVRSNIESEFRQGEILTNVVEFRCRLAASDEGVEATTQVNGYSVILSQDCDLERDFEQRKAGRESGIPNLLLYQAEEASNVKVNVGGGERWKRIVQNNDDRWHYLCACRQDEDFRAEGFPALLIDFRRFFTLNPAELYAQCGNDVAQRRCRLEAPYREHLQCRAGAYFQRVGLPTPHFERI